MGKHLQRLWILFIVAGLWGGCLATSEDPCVRNSDCADPNARCVDGACRVECVEARDCAEGEVCEAGACVASVRTCRTDDDCVFGERCQNGECTLREDYCERNGDCAEGFVCRGEISTCVPISDNNGVEPECVRNSDCAADELCQDNACVAAPEPDPECVRDSDCAAGQRCAAEVCVDECAEDRDCGDDEVCDRGRCLDAPPDPTCTQDASLCAPSEECCEGACVTRGQCGPPPTCDEDPTVCAASQECCGGACVPQGTCSPGDYWAVCTARAQCSTELCLGDPQTGEGHCTQRCNFRQECPSSPSSLCIQSYHSLAQQVPEISGLCFADDTGRSCQGPNTCFDGLCMGRINELNQADQRCTIRCQFGADCPTGYGCGAVTFGAGQTTTVLNVCVPLGGPCAGVGEQAANQCFTGICLTDDQTNTGYCTSWCAEDGNCAPGWRCEAVAQDASVCVRQ